jgi:hypothetical protein
MSNLLAMPLCSLVIETGNNEDWIDSIKFVIDVDEDPQPQLDLTGIDFEMEVRRTPDDVEVILAASTANGTLMIGDAPDTGFLIIQVPLADMKDKKAGKYVADIVGMDGEFTRAVAQIELVILEGVTKKPVNKRIVVQGPET